jgi:ribonuclease H-related protein
LSKKKFYAVRKGRSVGIFSTWNECQQSINGYSNAEYKSFVSKCDAEDYIKGINSKKNDECSNVLVIYTDGSYSEKVGKYSFGCVILEPNGKKTYKKGYGNNPNALNIRNVAGELLGIMFAIKWAYKNNYKKLIIKHDYEGISKWYSKEWKAKNSLVKKYVEFLGKYEGLIEISFEKVNAHSGNKYNDKADELAKEALGIVKNINKGDSWVNVEKFDIKDLEIIIKVVKEDIKDLSIRKSNEAYCIKYNIASKCYNDKIVIKYYNEKNKLVVQGKPEKLFNVFLAYITELVDIDQIPKIYNEYCKLDINKENVIKEYENYLPQASDKLPCKISKSLKQAVYNLNIDGDMFEPTFLVFPALRALEGYIIMILKKYGIPVDNNFNMFKIKNNNTYKIDDGLIHKIGSPKKIKYINKCYNFFHKNRHQLFHWNDPCLTIDDTRMIGSVDGAKKLIKDTLSLINEYYTIN